MAVGEEEVDAVLLLRDGVVDGLSDEAEVRDLDLVAPRRAGIRPHGARDGEGATKLIEFTVNGATNVAEAKLAARTVISSPLVKAAVHGGDPNWGRIVTAVGHSGVEVVESSIDLYIGGIPVLKGGQPLPFSNQSIVRVLKASEVPISMNLNRGVSSATAWGCDLSPEYVTINSQYMT